MKLFLHRIFRSPVRTFTLLCTFGRHMSKRDLLKLLWSPFRKRQLTLTPALPAGMIEQGLTAPIGLVATGSGR